MIPKTLTAEQRLEKAVLAIMHRPEYVALAGVMMIGKRVVSDDAKRVPTACTNGRDEWYGRAFVDKLSDAELRFLILHEVYHKLYRHLTTWRWMYDKHAKVANMACVVGETLITMADGSARRAEDVRVGDMVATPFGPSPVLATRATDDREVCELDMHMGNKLICTPDHKILTERGYVEAQHITEADRIYLDTRDGEPAAREAWDYADQGHGSFARCHPAGGVWKAKKSRPVRFEDDREASLTEQLGLLVAYGLGILRWASGRGRHGYMPACAGEIPETCDVRYEHELQLNALVGVAGNVLRSSAQQLRQYVLESGGERVRDTTGAGGYPTLGEDPHSSIRHTDGNHQDPHGAWLSVPPDTAHHELVGRVEGFESARFAARRLLGARRRVYDITTAAQCFVAQDVVVHNCDYVINIQLSDAHKDGWAKMPDGGLCDPKYRGWDSAKVFEDLMKNAKEQPQGGGGQGQPGSGSGDGQPQPGGFDEHDWDGAQEMTAEEKEDLARDIDEALRQGALAAGKMGSGGDRSFEDLLQPKVDWREALREFVQTTCAGSDYSTWQRPNRRYLGAGYYMPSGISEQIGEIVVAPDMSGSIGSTEIRAMLSEVKGISDTVHPEAIRLLYWDTEVTQDERYETHELDTMMQATTPKGGGGTMPDCVPQYMAKNNINAQCAVVLTDGYVGSWGNWPCPVLWVIVDNKHANPPFGKAVHIEARDLS